MTPQPFDPQVPGAHLAAQAQQAGPWDPAWPIAADAWPGKTHAGKSAPAGRSG